MQILVHLKLMKIMRGTLKLKKLTKTDGYIQKYVFADSSVDETFEKLINEDLSKVKIQ